MSSVRGRQNVVTVAADDPAAPIPLPVGNPGDSYFLEIVSDAAKTVFLVDDVGDTDGIPIEFGTGVITKGGYLKGGKQQFLYDATGPTNIKVIVVD